MNKNSYNDRGIDDGKIAGVVVIYNCGNEVLENIATYLNQVHKLYVVDNSDVINIHLVQYCQSILSIEYIRNFGNLGIANALNKAAHRAIYDGFTYLLTMDDDSKAPTNLINIMLSFLTKYPKANQIGILSVAHNKHKRSSYYEQVNLTMTSGNLLCLNAFKIIGDFNDELFIDHVDHEYNLRLHLKGFYIIEISNLRLSHKLGTEKHRLFFAKKITYVSHSPLRLYYFVRNAIYIVRKYYSVTPSICLILIWLGIKELIKTVFLETEKNLRITYFFQAIIDGFQGKLAKLTLLAGKRD